MIVPSGTIGVAFTDTEDGDMRGDLAARGRIANRLGVQPDWATVSQSHGADVIEVDEPGEQGPADGMWTMRSGLPLAVFTADCLGVVLRSDDAVGVAHAGWRGADAGVLPRLREAMVAAGHVPRKAWIGPAIGKCCFEVGRDVAELFPDHLGSTSWGTTSVDLRGVARGQLEGLKVWSTDACTMHEDRYLSHRRDRSPARMATLSWLE
jgi:purine-nucleoside/S-methyl-5'-thioadenosine phosphorylase / adenosine deaminase